MNECVRESDFERETERERESDREREREKETERDREEGKKRGGYRETEMRNSINRRDRQRQIKRGNLNLSRKYDLKDGWEIGPKQPEEDRPIYNTCSVTQSPSV